MSAPKADYSRPLIDLLDAARAQGQSLPFWWRDDDAEQPSAELERLVGLAARRRLPLALAVVPKRAGQPLADLLAAAPPVQVLQHGWAHTRHSPPGEKKKELGEDRPLPVMLDELRSGRDRLASLFPQTFLPVLVPPWNRIAATVREARHRLGLPGLSTFGTAPAGELHCVNVHVDIIDWIKRAPLPRSAVYAGLVHEVARRLAGSQEPIGLMTHHLVHAEESWAMLDELLALLAEHPAIRWPSIPELFDLRPVAVRPAHAPA